MSEQGSQPAGWYVDPWQAAETRWWDGEEWTSHLATADGRIVSTPPGDVRTGTVWIWLIVLLPLLSTILLLVTDPFGDPAFLDELTALADPTAPLPGYPSPPSFSAVDIVNFLLPIATIILAYVDWRTLRNRGIDRPFGWGWSFFSFLVSSGVYVIGRGVVLRRRTGRGLAPVWVWIGVTVFTTVCALTYTFTKLGPVFTSLVESGLSA